MEKQVKLNVYLFQPQYAVEIRKENTYWLPYSAGCIWSYASTISEVSKKTRNLQQSKGTNRMSYEGVTLPCGLKVKNGEIITEPQHDFKAINDFILKINAGPIFHRLLRK
jgi:hypothetical protein